MITISDGPWLVCGSRFYDGPDDEAAVWAGLDAFLALRKRRPSRLIEGEQVGVDQMARRWAVHHGIEVAPYPALHKTHGDHAFTRRNSQMLIEGKPKRALVFPGGSGTRDMLVKLVEAKVPVTFACIHRMTGGDLSTYLSPSARGDQWLGKNKTHLSAQ